ncbi:MAG: Dyp-type peroxidase, partial [Acidimicrobiia bacterium]
MTGSISRRRLLGAGAASAVGALGATALASCSSSDGQSTDVAAAASTGSVIDHLGIHQPGIVTPGPARALVAAFDTTATDITGLRDLLRELADETDALNAMIPFPQGDPLLPPPDNGIVGMAPEPDDLTITVALGASLFDDRFGLSERKPRELIRMPNFPNDDPDPARSHGDLLIQICGGTDETTHHALRRLMRVSRRHLTLRWMQTGFQRPNTMGTGRTSTRNLLGFKDGTANPDATSEALMNKIVWVQPGDDEPEWAVGGTYQVARIIRNRVEFWDRTALRTQELIMGRHKDTGAVLGALDEAAPPDYASDPDGTVTPLTAHIRLANPRTPETDVNLILRRGFSYSSGFTNDGQLDQGLLFVCFQRSLTKGFVAVQNRLNGEALEEYIRPVGGGFYFA